MDELKDLLEAIKKDYVGRSLATPQTLDGLTERFSISKYFIDYGAKEMTEAANALAKSNPEINTDEIKALVRIYIKSTIEGIMKKEYKST